MHVFYTPDIQTSTELPEEEAQHCVRVLRLTEMKLVSPTERETSIGQRSAWQPINVAW